MKWYARTNRNSDWLQRDGESFPSPIDAETISILVADASTHRLRRLARALVADGHHVTEIDSQANMLQLLAESLLVETPVYPLLICSATLPGWSGLNLLHALLESQSAPRVILLRDWTGDNLLASAYRQVAVAVLDREVSDDDLRSATRHVLSTR
jgi:CheY-like chemotaxis protein